MQTASPEKIAYFHSLGWWGDTTTWQLFEQAAAADPGAIALLDPANRQSFTTGQPLALSWGELRRRALALAGELKRDGIARGDVVVLQLPNTVESVASYLALAALGAVASPVPMQYGLHELREIAHKLHPRAYVAAAHFRGEDFTARHAGAFAPDTRLIALDHRLIGTDRAVDESVIASGVSADEVYTICWTSGTTGTPKGVPRSHNQWLAQTEAMHGIGIEAGHDDAVSVSDGEHGEHYRFLLSVAAAARQAGAAPSDGYRRVPGADPRRARGLHDRAARGAEHAAAEA